MKHNDSSLHSISSAGWRLLGEFKLSSAADPVVSPWLDVILRPLELQADFIAKVVKSAQAAITRLMQLEDSAPLDHLHILVFVTADLEVKRQSWGFFRIEKVGTAEGNAHHDHTIELYLYLE